MWLMGIQGIKVQAEWAEVITELFWCGCGIMTYSSPAPLCKYQPCICSTLLLSVCCAGMEMCAYFLLPMHKHDPNIRLLILPTINEGFLIHTYIVVGTPLTIKKAKCQSSLLHKLWCKDWCLVICLSIILGLTHKKDNPDILFFPFILCPLATSHVPAVACCLPGAAVEGG